MTYTDPKLEVVFLEQSDIITKSEIITPPVSTGDDSF